MLRDLWSKYKYKYEFDLDGCFNNISVQAVTGCLEDLKVPKQMVIFSEYVNSSLPDLRLKELKEETEIRRRDDEGMEIINKFGLPQGLP